MADDVERKLPQETSRLPVTDACDRPTADRRERVLSVGLSRGGRASPSVLEGAASGSKSPALEAASWLSARGLSPSNTNKTPTSQLKGRHVFKSIMRHHCKLSSELRGTAIDATARAAASSSVGLSASHRHKRGLCSFVGRHATNARACCRRRRHSRVLRCVFVV